jgi:hypothetical protein
MDLDAEVIPLRMVPGNLGERLTVAEPDVENHRRATSEDSREVQRSLARLDAIVGE